MVKKKTGISRDLLIHPGETIADVLEEREIKQSELAMRTGVTPAYISKVINGKKDISAKFAMSLEYALGVKKSFWLNLQAIYDAELLELNELDSITVEERETVKHLKEIIKYLRKECLIEIKESIDDSIISLRKFFKMSDISNLSKIVEDGAFRISKSTSVDPYVLGGWIRLCQLFGEQQEISTSFSEDNIQNLIDGLKNIMVKNDGDIQEDLTTLMKDYGIDFSIMHHFKGAPVHGYVSRKKDGAYQMYLTIRRSFADEFWFSLFHELGHIVNGDVDNKSKFIDYDDNKEIEDLADKFASSALLNENDYKIFVHEKNFSLNNIIDFAEKQNVMPYIVIGRLKREKYLEYYQFADQMLKYKWAE